MIAEKMGAQMEANRHDPFGTGPSGEAPRWVSFPAHERLLHSQAARGLLEKMEQTHRDLTLLEKSGTPSEAARARAARTAYGHALELLGAIRGVRRQPAGK